MNELFIKRLDEIFLQEKKENWEDTAWENDKGSKVTIGHVINWLKDKPVLNVNVKELSHMLLSDLDKTRVKQADVNYPIIVVKSEGKYSMIIDGHHRLQKIIDNHGKSVKTKVLDLKDPKIPPEFVNVFT